MSDPVIAPCLWFDDQASKAASFYIETFGSGRVVARTLFPSSHDNPVGQPRGGLMSVEFEIHGQRFTAVNGGPRFVINPSISFFVYTTSAAEARRLFAQLSRDGQTLMPLDAYPWSACYGWAADRFGVSWQVMLDDSATPSPAIAPSLMFCGAQFGNASTAMAMLCGVFPNSRITRTRRHGANEDSTGSVKEGRFALAGQNMVAMDSPGEHAFTFNEAVSLQVLCDDQAALDHFWQALSDGGERGQCGWLQDRFGISWQVVPKRWVDWLGSSVDAAARDRVFKAMLPMTKLDLATLERAFAASKAAQTVSVWETASRKLATDLPERLAR